MRGGFTSVMPCVYSSGYQSYVRVDVIEDNWLLNADGSIGLRQIVLWDFSEVNGKFDYYVRDWALTDKCSRVTPLGGEWVITFRGAQVRAKIYRETAYMVDVEVLDRSRLPESKRNKIARRLTE